MPPLPEANEHSQQPKTKLRLENKEKKFKFYVGSEGKPMKLYSVIKEEMCEIRGI